ncbi:radical SAM protein [Patescibacteria group bacterium]
MKSSLKVLLASPSYKAFRAWGVPRKLPFNLTVLISTKCNSRCKTCNIWKQKHSDLEIKEWKKILKSIDQSPFWVTVSGGEPFLQPHITELVKVIYEICQPAMINIPTNSLLAEKIYKDVEKILKDCPKTKLVINLSLDGVDEKHDQIRGIKLNFQRVLKNYHNLKRLQKKYPNLTIGIHSVVSRFNVKHLPELIDFAYSLKPDQYITEIAEERIELDTMGMKITPKYKDYAEAIDYLISKMKQEKLTGLGRITRAFRLEYYEFVKDWLKGKSLKLSDYAGWASAEITSWGEVWPSCIKGINLGNLRDNNYDFKKIWFGEKAKEFRKKFKNKPESFPLANAFYSNAITNYSLLTKVLLQLTKL